MQVTTLLTEADKALAKIDEAAGDGGDGAAWLQEAQDLAADVKKLQAAEAEQGDTIRTLKEEMKGLQGEEKSAVNGKVQKEVNALKKMKQETAQAQERYVSAAHAWYSCTLSADPSVRDMRRPIAPRHSAR